jgi:hypothetical protein
MFSRFEVFSKALDPMTVIESGNVIVVSVCVLVNADSPISVVPAGTEYVVPVFAFGYLKSVLPLNRTPSVVLKVVLPTLTVIDARLESPLNAAFGRADIDEGRFNDSMRLALSNAAISISVVPDGTVYEVSTFLEGYLTSVLPLNRTPSVALKVVLPALTVIDARLESPLSEPSARVDIDAGSSNESMRLALSNAYGLISVVPDGTE